MLIRTLLLTLVSALLLACASYQPPRFLTYDGPQVTRIVVHKGDRRMELWNEETVLRAFDIQLGREPVGHKERRGDGRTPEGEYIIDRRNPNSRFHLSLGISYPEVHQREAASEAGIDPGGDIFIHGRGPEFRRARGDWTEGCIAVSDREIEVIYAMVRDRTPITILP